MELDLRQEIAIATVIGVESLPCSMLGQKKIFTIKGEGKKGNLSLPWASHLPWLEEQLAELVKKDMSKGLFKVATINNPDEPDQIVKVMLDPYLTPNELIILGGGHIAQQLVIVGRLLGYKITVIDDRLDVVLAKGLDEPDRNICCNFNDIENVLNLGPSSSVVIVTRGHMHDMECLRKVIKYPLAYLGMIGSSRKIKMVRDQLKEDGINTDKINEVHMPIGLDIGAQTPVEIAISIVAEMIKVRRAGSGNSLKNVVSKTVDSVNDGEMLSATDRETVQKAIRAASDNTPAALATIVESAGSTPRKAGAKMLIYRDGKTQGTIGGGSVEEQVRLEALNVIDKGKPCIHKVSLSADIAALEGMVCGGMQEVFIEPVKTFSFGL